MLDELREEEMVPGDVDAPPSLRRVEAAPRRRDDVVDVYHVDMLPPVELRRGDEGEGRT